MIDSLKKFNSTNIEHDIYLQNFSNDVIKNFEEIFDVNLSRKYLTLSEIKKKFKFLKISSDIQQSKNEELLILYRFPHFYCQSQDIVL